MGEQPDVECGLPLTVGGAIDWHVLGEHWSYLASVGVTHDQPRPVRESPFDPRCQADLLLYGESLVWGIDGQVVLAYLT